MKYTKNEDYFKTWSHNMAYILGFSLADATVYHTDIKSHTSYCLRYVLSSKDISILEFIQQEICPSSPIKIYKHTNHKLNKIYNNCLLAISSKEIVNDIMNLGVLPQRTSKEKLPNIPEEYKYSFLLGFFDGDGSYERNNKHLPFTMSFYSGGIKILEEINNSFQLNFNIHLNHGKYYRLQSRKLNNIINLSDKIYTTECKFHLQRKYERYLILSDYYNKVVKK